MLFKALFTGILLFCSVSLSAEEYNGEVLKKFRGYFPDAKSFLFGKYPSKTSDAAGEVSAEVADQDTFMILRAIGSHGLSGLGMYDSVMCKSSAVAFLLVVDIQLRIIGVEIIRTTGTYGARLRSGFWRGQFVGKGAEDLNSVDAASGATLSSECVTARVRQLLALYKSKGS